MNNLDLIVEAITTKKPISFKYNKNGKAPGVRIGNPYVVFNYTTKSGTQNTYVHLVQTDGHSQSNRDVISCPEFRTLKMEDISNVKILASEPSFDPDHEGFNPASELYKNAIAVV